MSCRGSVQVNFSSVCIVSCAGVCVHLFQHFNTLFGQACCEVDISNGAHFHTPASVLFYSSTGTPGSTVQVCGHSTSVVKHSRWPTRVPRCGHKSARLNADWPTIHACLPTATGGGLCMPLFISLIHSHSHADTAEQWGD